jgi:hypothetical protein
LAFAELRYLQKDESGAALIEFTAAAFTFFIVLFGIVEFSNVYYQWNAATKAVQLGARLAAVSDPVVPGLRDVTGLSSTVLPGDPMPSFEFSCWATNEAATSGTCTGGITYDSTVSAAAIKSIVYGIGKNACSPSTSSRDRGMCNIFTRVKPQNIEVRYQYTGLGYAGRPGGPVPTITVSLRGLQYDFFLLGAFIGTNSITMPSFATTVTGEDLNASWSS